METTDTQPIATQDETWTYEHVDPDVWGKAISANTEHPSINLIDHTVTIGRKSTNTINIKHTAVSGVHCTIIHDPVSYHTVLVDSSTNGTWVDGVRSEKGVRTVLNNGAEITLIRNPTETISYNLQFVNQPKQTVDCPELHRLYDVRNELGKGAFASVRLVVHIETGVNYAVKIIEKKKFALNHGSRRGDALKDEVRILKQLDHPNIIKLYDVFESDDFLYLILELVTGGDLFDRVIAQNGQGISERLSREVFTQILDATEYLHSMNVVHRDLKPENVLLLNTQLHASLDSINHIQPNLIKITDFGLSRIIGQGSFMKTLCGTPQYLAPEVLSADLLHDGYDRAVDLWSLGVVLYVMLTGMAPFNENKHLIDEVKNARYSFPQVHWKNKSIECQELIRNLLNADVTQRWTIAKIRSSRWMTMTDAELKAAAIRNQLMSNGPLALPPTANGKRKRPDDKIEVPPNKKSPANGR